MPDFAPPYVDARALGLVADGATPQGGALNAILDDAGAAGGGYVQLPPGVIPAECPVVCRRPNVFLAGAPGRRTVLSTQFAAGPAVLVQAPRPLHETGPSLVPGPGSALRLRPWTSAAKPGLSLGDVPGMDLSAAEEFTAEFWCGPESLPADGDYGVLLSASADYGVKQNHGLGLWLLPSGGLRLYWAGVPHDTAPWLVPPGQRPHLALAYGSGAVRVFVAGSKVLEVPASGPVPVLPRGLSDFTIGYMSTGPSGGIWAWGPPDGWVDGFRFERACRYVEDFTPPARKYTAADVGPDTILLMNFEESGPFFLGRTPDGDAHVLPLWTADTQMGVNGVCDLELWCNRGTSGVYFYDARASQLRDVLAVNPWFLCRHLGSCYTSRVLGLEGAPRSVGWTLTPQAMSMTVDDVRIGSHALGLLARGSVGGRFGLLLKPEPGAMAIAYLSGFRGAEFHVQGDDEGDAGATEFGVIVDAANLNLTGGVLARALPGPVADCCRGGTVNVFGTHLVAQPGTEELVRYHGPPDRPGVALGHTGTEGVPLTLTPEYLITVPSP